MAKGKYQEWLTKDGLMVLEGWARDGLTDEQIASNIGVSTTTLYNWKAKHVEIFEALKRGKEVVDIQVENALLKRALGYEYTEETIEIGPTGKKIKQTVKQVVPDTTAQIFWLKNRQPEKWRDKPLEAKDDHEDNGLIGAISNSSEGVWDEISEIQPETNEGTDLVGTPEDII